MRKIIFHELKKGTPCQDGIAAAWAVFKKYPDAEVIGWCYQDANAPIAEMELPNVQPGDELYIVDFSFTKDVLDMWASSGVMVTVLDHHKSAWERLQGFSAGILKFDMGKSGAVMAWEHCHPKKPVPAILQYVEAQDLWQYKLPSAEAVLAAMPPVRMGVLDGDLPKLPLWKSIYNNLKYAYLAPKVKSSFQFFDALENMSIEQIVGIFEALGKAEIAERAIKVVAIASRARWADVLGYRVRVVEFLDAAEHSLRSHVLAHLYNAFPESAFTAGYRIDGSKQIWDLRSSKESAFDCSALAKIAGGGGHFHAAGFSIKQEN